MIILQIENRILVKRSPVGGFFDAQMRDKNMFVEVQEHIPIEVAILAAFLFYRYKFL